MSVIDMFDSRLEIRLRDVSTGEAQTLTVDANDVLLACSEVEKAHGLTPDPAADGGRTVPPGFATALGQALARELDPRLAACPMAVREAALAWWAKVDGLKKSTDGAPPSPVSTDSTAAA